MESTPKRRADEPAEGTPRPRGRAEAKGHDDRVADSSKVRRTDLTESAQNKAQLYEDRCREAERQYGILEDQYDKAVSKISELEKSLDDNIERARKTSDELERDAPRRIQ